MSDEQSDKKRDDDLPGMLAVAKGVAEQTWPHTMDASVWAAEFVKQYPGHDEGDMIGWFANAIMAGYDAAQSRAAVPELQRRDEQSLPQREGPYVQPNSSGQMPSPAEVPTPRVDEEVVLIPVGVEGLEAEFVHAEFARQLERELIVATHNAECFKALYRDAEATIERQALSLEAPLPSI